MLTKFKFKAVKAALLHIGFSITYQTFITENQVCN